MTGPSAASAVARIAAAPGDLRPFLHGEAVTSKTLTELDIRIEGDRAAALALLAAVGRR